MSLDIIELLKNSLELNEKEASILNNIIAKITIIPINK